MFKLLIILLSFFVIDLASADSQWFVVGETVDCPRKIIVKAKEGEDSLRVVDGGKEVVLFPEGNYVFMKNSPIDLDYDSYNRNGKQEGARYLYQYPSKAQESLGIVIIKFKGKSSSCKLEKPYK